MQMRSRSRWLWAASLLIVSCSGDPGDGDAGADGGAAASDGSQSDAASGGESGDASANAADTGTGESLDGSQSLPDAGTPFEVNESGEVLCGTDPCACSNGVDDDEDGLTDLEDPECVSSWDDDEGSFATGISGDNRDDACQDCFFDGNSGSGNDGCRLPSSCLVDGTASSGQGSCSSCEQTEACQTYCEAYTPNGCDCFGCCDVRLGGVIKHVLLGEGCQIDGATTEGCTECVPSDSCVNECGKCELCAGKTVADLPPECFQAPSDAGVPADAGADGGSDAGTPPGYTCDNGEQVCGAGLAACADGFYCEFGCCLRIPVVVL